MCPSKCYSTLHVIYKQISVQVMYLSLTPAVAAAGCAGAGAATVAATAAAIDSMLLFIT